MVDKDVVDSLYVELYVLEKEEEAEQLPLSSFSLEFKVKEERREDDEEVEIGQSDDRLFLPWCFL